MIVVGIDPGLTTGVCVVNSFAHPLRWGEFVGAKLFGELREIFTDIVFKEPIIVMESSVNFGAVTAGKVAQLKVMGVIEYLADVLQLSLVLVSPEERKRVEYNLNEGNGKHANDAYKVAVSFLINGGHLEHTKFISPKREE